MDERTAVRTAPIIQNLTEIEEAADRASKATEANDANTVMQAAEEMRDACEPIRRTLTRGPTS